MALKSINHAPASLASDKAAANWLDTLKRQLEAAQARILTLEGGGGPTAINFIELADTFASYAGKAAQALRVNAGETGIESYTPSAAPYDLWAFSGSGTLSAGQLLIRNRVTRPFRIALDCAGGYASSSQNATGNRVFNIYHDVTITGTITYANGTAEGVFSMPQTDYAIGELFIITAPATGGDLQSVGVTIPVLLL